MVRVFIAGAVVLTIGLVAVIYSVVAAPAKRSDNCGNVTVDDTGTITTSGKNSPHVRVTTKRPVEYTNDGEIVVHDDNCPGISAKVKGGVKVENKGTITTTGDSSPGISIEAK